MRELWFILALVFLLVWDISQNHGRLIGGINAVFWHLMRQLGIG
jgi:hypothetical protein